MRQGLLATNPVVLAFLCAELVFFLTRHRDIIVLVKSPRQRNSKEKRSVERGLFREVLLEGAFFVPISVTIFLLAVLPLIWNSSFLRTMEVTTIYSTVGVASYGFPYATFRRIVTVVALRTLKEFSRIIEKDRGLDLGESSTQE